MIKEENILPHFDSVFGTRVINLPTNGKTIADFKNVSAIAEEGGKPFEFRK